MAQPRMGMADALRAALPFSSPRISPPRDLNENSSIARALIAEINAQLDKEAAAEHPADGLPTLLRQFKDQENFGDFAAMVDFANHAWQVVVKWRDCAAHQERLSNMDLADPKEALWKMADEIRGIDRSGDDGSNGVGLKKSEQTMDTTLFHPSFAAKLDPRSRSSTPQSPTGLRSPYTLPSNAVPTPTSSPKPRLTQEYLPQSWKNLAQNHMPRLTSNINLPPYESAVHGSPNMNGNTTPSTGNRYGEMQSFVTTSVYNSPYGSPAATISGGHQGYGRTQIAPSQTGQPIQHQAQHQQQYTHPPFDTSLYRSTFGSYAPNMIPKAAASHQNGTNSPRAQPQQRNGTVRPYTEFAEEIHRLNNGQPPKLYLPGNLSSPLTRQLNPHAQPRAQQLTAEQSGWMNEQRSGSRSLQIANYPDFNTPVVNPQITSSGMLAIPGTSYPRNSNTVTVNPPISTPGMAAGPGASYPRRSNTVAASPQLNSSQTYGRATPPAPPSPPPPLVPPQTREEIEYERQMAVWKTYQADKEKQARVEQEWKSKLKEELDAEMRITGNEILAYRYRDYLEVYPCEPGARRSTYHLSLLANQVIQENDYSEEAMAVRYAKEKWWNYWTVKDKEMMMEKLRERRKNQVYGMAEDMKTGGYMVTAADIDAIRMTVTWASPEGGFNVKDGMLEE